MKNTKTAARAERHGVASPDLRASPSKEISRPLRFWNVPETAHLKAKGALKLVRNFPKRDCAISAAIKF